MQLGIDMLQLHQKRVTRPTYMLSPVGVLRVTLNMVVLLADAATLKALATLLFPRNTGVRSTTLGLEVAWTIEALAERVDAPTTQADFATAAEAMTVHGYTLQEVLL